MKPAPCLLTLLLACSPPAEEPARGTPETTLLMTRNPVSNERELRVQGAPVGILRVTGSRETLEIDSTRASIERSERPISAGKAYPRRVVTEGRLEKRDLTVREEYILLAPPAPIRVEGLGLEVSTDEPGINAEEHRALREWLRDEGLAADTGDFEALHFAETGRELTVWYEISGKRVSGRLTRGTSTGPEARFDSLFHTTDEGWKIHHQRIGENGRFRYHRRSLELVDTIFDATREEEPRELRSYHCGCYGYAIASDWATLGDSYLYHVELEWLNHRVAAGFFVGWERQERFPWIGIGDRQRARLLARRAKAYRVTDARNKPFAEVVISFPVDPPRDGLGAATYEVRLWGPNGGMKSLARIEYAPNEVAVHLSTPPATDARPADHGPDWEIPLERLDTLLAAMPTQVLRGDGVRDSHLGEIETMLDWIRLIREPSEDNLADVVSEIDALTAVSKVHALLKTGGARFSADEQELPPPPKRHPVSPGAGGRQHSGADGT